MTVQTHKIQLSASGNMDVIDITDRVNHAIKESNLLNGTVTIFCPSSTSALTTIEYESGLISDLKRLFDQIVDPQQGYAHNLRWGDGNGHSHIRASLLGASLTVPFVQKRMTLGTWQQIIYLDFDIRPRHRELILQIIGE